MRIAFFFEGRTGWMAGYTYLSNLLTAIRLCGDKHVDICLLQDSDDDASSSANLTQLADEVLTLTRPTLARPTVQRWSLRGLKAQFDRKAEERPHLDTVYRATLYDFLRANRVDVVFGSWWQYPRSSASPSVGMCAWIHDFQFLHFPHLYDSISLQTTRRDILRMVDVADVLVVSSQDALKDFLSFAPRAAPKARVLPFVADIPGQVYACDPEVVARQYHLPEKFIYLPNQFWQHKNHHLVLEALHILSQRGVRPHIACSGLPHDSRKEAHFAELLRQVSEWGLHEQIRFLGLVPPYHVKALIRQAICVLNPSLFEGWSSTVEEAKSLGKRLLLSDLSVHREQNPPGTIFFDPRDPQDLAVNLQTIWRDWAPGPDLHLEAAARQSLPTRMRQFGEAFLSIVGEVDLLHDSAPLRE